MTAKYFVLCILEMIDFKMRYQCTTFAFIFIIISLEICQFLGAYMIEYIEKGQIHEIKRSK